jgi:alpha-L-fucosidase
MHARIRQLVVQSGFDTWSDTVIVDGVDITQTVENLAKFIIADAINTVEKRFMGDLNREDMEVRRCVEALKAHFGVE